MTGLPAGWSCVGPSEYGCGYRRVIEVQPGRWLPLLLRRLDQLGLLEAQGDLQDDLLTAIEAAERL